MKGQPQKIVFFYLAITTTWMLASDYLVEMLAFIWGSNSYALQTGKGFFFISVTTCLLYFGIKKQQKLLVNHAEQYKSLFHSNPNPLWIYDSNSLRFLEVNDAAIRIYGYSREEFKNMAILDIRPKADRQRVKEFVNELPEGYHDSGNWTHLKKNGKMLTVAVTSHKIRFNERDCVMTMAQDITLRIQQEEKLKQSYKLEKELTQELENNMEVIKQSLESKRRLAEVVDRVSNIVIISDPMGIIMWVNHAFEDFTGYRLREVIGRSYDFLHGPKTDLGVLPTIRESIEASGFATAEFLHYTKAGVEYWVEISISAIYNEKKEMERYIAIHNIITERKIREEKIKEQNRILSKHSWINSHAIRKPVASILGLVSLSKEMLQVEDIKEIHSLIEISSIELDGIIKEIAKELNTYEESD
jgi:PAS domain S-box-containing protein